MIAIPYINISVARLGDKTFFFIFRDPHSGEPFPFPDNTIFKFRAKSDSLDIQRKTGDGISYDSDTGEIRLDLYDTDTESATQDESVYYEMDAFLPTGERYPLCKGNLRVGYRKGLNTPPS